MSQMMLQRPRAAPAIHGTAIPFECAVCGRGLAEGVAITASVDAGVKMMLCDSHLPAAGA